MILNLNSSIYIVFSVDRIWIIISLLIKTFLKTRKYFFLLCQRWFFIHSIKQQFKLWECTFLALNELFPCIVNSCQQLSCPDVSANDSTVLADEMQAERLLRIQRVQFRISVKMRNRKSVMTEEIGDGLTVKEGRQSVYFSSTSAACSCTIKSIIIIQMWLFCNSSAHILNLVLMSR